MWHSSESGLTNYSLALLNNVRDIILFCGLQDQMWHSSESGLTNYSMALLNNVCDL